MLVEAVMRRNNPTEWKPRIQTVWSRKQLRWTSRGTAFGSSAIVTIWVRADDRKLHAPLWGGWYGPCRTDIVSAPPVLHAPSLKSLLQHLSIITIAARPLRST